MSRVRRTGASRSRSIGAVSNPPTPLKALPTPLTPPGKLSPSTAVNVVPAVLGMCTNTVSGPSRRGPPAERRREEPRRRTPLERVFPAERWLPSTRGPYIRPMRSARARFATVGGLEAAKPTPRKPLLEFVRGLKAGKPEHRKPLVAFVHIPRTGGGSLTNAISRAYGRVKSSGNVQLSADKSHKLFKSIAENPDAWSGRALADHVPYGLYARYLPPDTLYITVLRDPVERVL